MNWPFWSPRRPASSDAQSENCDGIEPLLSLYADGMAAPEESRRVAAHLTTCADCRESLAWMQATHRALASRPIVAPPADLQARIAEAIAASSAAPIRLSPTRAFILRPAYAAAASLTVLGIVLSVSLLQHSAPPVQAVHPPRPSTVAVNPTSPLKTPASHAHPVVAQGSTQPRIPVRTLTVHPTVRHEERVATVPVPSTELPAAPFHKSVRDTQSELAVKVPMVNPQRRTQPRPALFASTHSGPAEPKPSLATPPIVTPKTIPLVLEATNLPKTTPSVPVSIGPSTVTTQTETPHLQAAADVLGAVRTKVIGLRAAGFTRIMNSANQTALSTRGNNVSDAAVQSMISIPLDH